MDREPREFGSRRPWSIFLRPRAVWHEWLPRGTKKRTHFSLVSPRCITTENRRAMKRFGHGLGRSNDTNPCSILNLNLICSHLISKIKLNPSSVWYLGNHSFEWDYSWAKKPNSIRQGRGICTWKLEYSPFTFIFFFGWWGTFRFTFNPRFFGWSSVNFEHTTPPTSMCIG